MKKPVNLRGSRVHFAHPVTRATIRGVVVTRIRGTRWLVESAQLSSKLSRAYNRIVLDREDFVVETPSASPARTPLEAMIDAACGVSSSRPKEPSAHAPAVKNDNHR